MLTNYPLGSEGEREQMNTQLRSLAPSRWDAQGEQFGRTYL